MWDFLGKTRSECDVVQDVLERTTSHGADDQVVALGTLLVQLPKSHRKHLNTCEDCRIFADELLEVRGMFGGELAGPQPGPYFMARVMASIADRELQLAEKQTQTWAAVPRLAYRFSVLASLLLLIAGSWLYQRPSNPTSLSVMNSDQHQEGLIEGSAPMQDDVLVNLADR